MPLMFMYAFFLLLMFFIFFGVSLILYYFKIDYMLEWLIFGFNSIMVEGLILMDWVSCLFISFVTVISFSVIMYSSVYMEEDKNLKRFLYLVIMFIVSMFLMIISPSLVSILFGWDLLGLVSYCLVIYYQNLGSYNSGMVTVLTNRIGDVGLLMCIGLLMMNGSWNWFLINENEYLILMMILVASLTKSAQMPFSSWLPMAMAAPTPVSSLVHSSTLVTAGVYLILRFNEYIMSSGISFILLILSVSTMFMSGIMAIFECDLKKVIALSTLSQLGMMMMILSLGLKMLGFYHLLTHAIFKSLLFLSAGGVIHTSKDTQDIRLFGNLSSVMPFISIGLYISVLALMGAPFMSGFYSKDLIIESLYMLKMNIMMMSYIFVSLMLTVVYSMRLCYYLFFGPMKLCFTMIYENKLMNFSMMILMGLSFSGGSLLSWMFFYDQEIVFLSGGLKVLVVMIFSVSLVLWFTTFLSEVGILKKDDSGKDQFIDFLKFKIVILFLCKMWMLNFMHLSFTKLILFISNKFSKMDLEWVESLEGGSFNVVKFMISKWYHSDYKLYNLLKVQSGLLIVIFIYLML